MKSYEYKNLISKYENIVSKVSGLYGYLGNTSSVINQCKTLMSETNIDGESVDKGKMDSMLAVLEQLQDTFNTVLAECKLKIASCEVLYASALQAESAESDKEGSIEV